ncbi:DUF2232 domain-containing protein [Bradyrhizobium sp.]|uniref:DUF2232 domain-containing protein n=1 Tax=Bradyrhizobium sp. TaxID=376 RepID=UPI003C5C46AF
MMAIIFIALAAGAASALMFTSIISGELISLLLMYLAPLPLMVAAMGWGSPCAVSGGAAAAVGITLIFGLPHGLAYAVAVALPAWWLGHLALLGRPLVGYAPPGAADSMAVAPALEWYPVGRILAWISGFAALTTFAALLTLGTDAATITATLHRGVLRAFSLHDLQPTGEVEQVVDALVMIAPFAASVVAVPTLALNLWLAAKVTKTSGRLRRPWPDLRATTLPPMTLVGLCVAIAFCFAGGLATIVAEVATAALLMAYALTGFAVLHTLTQTMKSRALWLGSAYAIVVIFTWPVLALVLLGLADAVFGLRQRYLRKRPPPLPVS